MLTIYREQACLRPPGTLLYCWRVKGWASEWCAVAGVEPALSVPALARVIGTDRVNAWRYVSGRKWPSAPVLLRWARGLGRPADAVLVACERAVERRKARDAARRAREDAE